MERHDTLIHESRIEIGTIFCLELRVTITQEGVLLFEERDRWHPNHDPQRITTTPEELETILIKVKRHLARPG